MAAEPAHDPRADHVAFVIDDHARDEQLAIGHLAVAGGGEDVARGAARVSATGGDRHFDELDRGRGRA